MIRPTHFVRTQQNGTLYILGGGGYVLCCQSGVRRETEKNGSKIWNSILNVRCRTTTIEKHLKSEMREEAMFAHNRRKTSYYDAEEIKK